MIRVMMMLGWSCGLLLGGHLLAQDEETRTTEQESPVVDESGDRGDFFTPTEEVEADTAVAFPTDI